MQIDTMLQDAILSYLKRVVVHADEVLLHSATISKRQLLRYVEKHREAAEEVVKLMEETQPQIPNKD